MTLWSGRFDGPPDKTAFEFNASFAFDRRLFEDDVRGSLAWVEELGAAGVIDRADAESLHGALESLLDAARRDPAFVDGPDEDVHTFVERKLIERLGDLGRRLHTGRSRNEQVSLDLRMYLRRRIPVIQDSITALVAALVSQAEAAREAIMPAFTHTRAAQPVLVAHFFLSHAAPLRRDHARLTGARDETDAMPLGSGAVAGTSFPIDPSRLADRLGFTRVVLNSIDAASDRDFVATFLHACALTMVHVSRLAEDLILLSGEQFAFFELSDATSTGSSMMPQKKNPDPLELVRGKSGRTIGRLAGWLTSMKGLPTGYNKDLQEDKEAVFDAEDTVMGSLAASRAVVEGLSVRAPRAAAASGGLLLATDVADYLTRRGVPFRLAHEIVGGLVRRLVASGRSDFAQLSPAEWRDASPAFGPDVADAFSPAASISARLTPQSTHPDAVRAAIAETKTWLASQNRP